MLNFAADRSDRSVGNRISFFRHLKTVSNALRPQLGHGQFDVDDLFELDRASIIAGGVYSGPAVPFSIDFADQRLTNRTQKFVFGLLHVGKEIRKMNDASGVRIAKLDTPVSFKNHGPNTGF